MAFAPLILRANITIDATDVDSQVSSLTLMGSRDVIRIPSTFGARSSVAGGDDTYQAKLDFLQDVDVTAITMILWELLADADGTFEVSGTFRQGIVSAANPRWTGIALATGVELGGQVNTVAVDSQTFELTGRPTKSVAP